MVAMPEAPCRRLHSQSEKKEANKMCGVAAWGGRGGEGGVRDRGLMVKRAIQRERGKNDAWGGRRGGVGVKETDNVAAACVRQHNSMIILCVQMCV